MASQANKAIINTNKKRSTPITKATLGYNRAKVSKLFKNDTVEARRTFKHDLQLIHQLNQGYINYDQVDAAFKAHQNGTSHQDSKSPEVVIKPPAKKPTQRSAKEGSFGPVLTPKSRPSRIHVYFSEPHKEWRVRYWCSGDRKMKSFSSKKYGMLDAQQRAEDFAANINMTPATKPQTAAKPLVLGVS
eukprot:Platyproteum_vivax@DN4945_c0_g1_i1.p1